MGLKRPKPFVAVDRRTFLQGTAWAAASSGLPLLNNARAESTGARPTPDEALDQLMAGHQRYLEDRSGDHDLASHRTELAKGQQPAAAVLSCADSRVVPDLLFDQPSGQLFVVRVAGNFVADEGQASLEYGVEFLGIPLVFVLGHSSCGAVDAAVKVVKDDAKLPGKLPGLADSIAPAVKDVLKAPGDLLDNAIAQNVRRNVKILREAQPIIGPAAASGKIRVVGGVYDIASGRVAMLDPAPK
ncbi:MAG: carbonic anhydrase [Myxococcota bacterium]|jgi:carbonic anhydrase|nr:carbonic anhydrase [Deltaproteobacteria bacterium]MCP4242154.1 carbonic anhydrase [bacterium]MDP6074117.1 carbonic anhydrase [Myxococcota bacterium]MDP6241812.1 carbonic anhydrase [Myxococcota bacterium]MDP7074552.1 carbonic anhydrase [Myxococcota bacterium]